MILLLFSLVFHRISIVYNNIISVFHTISIQQQKPVFFSVNLHLKTMTFIYLMKYQLLNVDHFPSIMVDNCNIFNLWQEKLSQGSNTFLISYTLHTILEHVTLMINLTMKDYYNSYSGNLSSILSDAIWQKPLYFNYMCSN